MHYLAKGNLTSLLLLFVYFDCLSDSKPLRIKLINPNKVKCIVIKELSHTHITYIR